VTSQTRAIRTLRSFQTAATRAVGASPRQIKGGGNPTFATLSQKALCSKADHYMQCGGAVSERVDQRQTPTGARAPCKGRRGTGLARSQVPPPAQGQRRGDACSAAGGGYEFSRKRCASRAAMHPVPALVMAWRYTWSCTSPAAKIPGTLVMVAMPLVPDLVRM